MSKRVGYAKGEMEIFLCIKNDNNIIFRISGHLGWAPFIVWKIVELGGGNQNFLVKMEGNTVIVWILQ